MTQPLLLSKDEPLVWSPGRGIDVWQMFVAASSGDLHAIKSLIGIDPSLVNCHFNYRTPMSFAVRHNHLGVAEYLLNSGANPVNAGTDDTLLTIARDRGYLEMQQLLEKTIHTENTAEGERLAAMIRNGELENLDILLGAYPELIHARDEHTNQPIHWAVMTRQPAMIDLLLSRGADIEATRADGARPLQLTNGDYHYRGWRDVPLGTVATSADIFNHLLRIGAYLDMNMACLTGKIDRVRELLEQDPNLGNRVSEYVSYYPGSGAPIKNAAIGGHIDIVRLLLESGADPNLPEEGIAPMGHALHSAVVYRHIDIVKLLLEYGAYPNVEIESSADTLSAAIGQKNTEMIELLCSHGVCRRVHLLAYYGDIQEAAAVFAANPSLADDTEALENAVEEGHASFVRLMLRYQPKLASRISVGGRSHGPDEAIKARELTTFLFQNGMNPNHKNWLGIAPLHVFARRNDVGNALLFLNQGADIDVVDEEYYSTPLGYAAKYGNKEMVEFLLQKGANPHLPYERQWATPLEWARRRGFEEVVSLLKSALGNR
jgi:ankyrin repeat protein